MAKQPATASKTTGTQVAPKSGGSSVPAHLRSKIKEDAGKGVSEDQDDSLVPMIVVLQAQSPQCIKQKPEYIKGAEAGDIWMKNAPHPIVKGTEGLIFQPCAFWKNVGEWIPRNKDGSGGGFVAIHDTMPDDMVEKDDPDNPDRKRTMSPRGTEYVETRNHAGIAYTDDGQAFPYLLPLSSSGHSVSRQWTFMMKTKSIDGDKVPSFAVLYRLKTIMRTKGNQTWFVIDPKEGGADGETLWATEEQYEAGKALHVAFAKGEKKADTSDMGAAGEAPVAAEKGKGTKEAGKHI